MFEYNIAGTAQTNNTATVMAASAIAAYPDLQVESLGVVPSSLYSGEAVVLQWQDANTGNAATPGTWDDRVVVQNTTTGQTLATVSIEYDSATLGAIAPGGSAARQYAFSLPTGPSSLGTIQFSVTTDALNQIFETPQQLRAPARATTPPRSRPSRRLPPRPTSRSPTWASLPHRVCNRATMSSLSWNDVRTVATPPPMAAWVDSVTVTKQRSGATIFTDTVPNNASSGSGR